ncbi:MAG TPA: ketopantoate reductase family protein [Burkholderiales bacterium]|nr:ketopantoate reductase family protein [Burkholderiales bacterium]
MKIAVMGSGGVGGYFGARLIQAGCDVAFVARGAHLAAMRERGLKIESQLGNVHLPKVRVTDDPATLEPVDLVLFSVKLSDTATAARSIAPLFGPNTGIVSFQNGVQKDDVLRKEFGDQAVMGGVGYIATAIKEPGVILHTGTMQRLVFGEYDGRRSERAEAFLAACKKGGIDAELSDDIRRRIWEKFVFLVGLSGATTAMRLPIGPIRENPLARGFLFDLIREAVTVGRALGVALPENYAEDRLAFVDGLPADMTASMHHDLQRGKPLEVTWLSGAVVELGTTVGVPTPANRAVRDILALHAQGR